VFIKPAPGEIKRSKVSWILKKKLDASEGPGEIKRREVVLDPQVSPEEIMRWCWTLKLAQKRSGAGRRSWAAKTGLLFFFFLLQVITQQRCNGHCPCNCPAQQLKQQYTSCCATVI